MTFVNMLAMSTERQMPGRIIGRIDRPVEDAVAWIDISIARLVRIHDPEHRPHFFLVAELLAFRADIRHQIATTVRDMLVAVLNEP
jgi:hypothetical protein